MTGDQRGDDVTGRWTLRLLAGSLAAAAVLSGCAAKHQASESLPAPSSAPTTQALPPLGPKDLPMPAEARTKDAAGAEAFVRYYIALINRTSKVMDAKPLRDFSQNCRDCNRIAGNIEEDARSGHTYRGGQITLTEVAPPLIKDTTAQMAMRVNQAALTVLDSSGKPLPELSSKAYPGLSGGAALVWNEASHAWSATALTLG